jgi:aarF domain-containing kinase
MTGMAPPGLFIEEVIRVGREELKVECDYIREMKFQKRLKQLVQSDFELTHDAKFVVPDVIEELTTSRIIVTEYCPGGTIEKVSHLDQQERNRIARNILKLTMKELFTWRFMQTDPNWGNFLYDMGTGITYLIDFGSAREFDKSFVDGYLRIVWAAANRDSDTLMSQSHTMGFLTGDENEIMLEAHKMSGFTIGEPFATNEIYDFASSGITGRISHHGSVFLQHRLTPPPSEVYSLHRKLAGAFNLCIKLGAKIRCRDLLEDVIKNHEFQDGLGTDSIHKFLHSR